ncbi:heptaprenylglyceryl phosphate synthase [Alteribacillus bidgolensis]|uniref:Heptaprenylglyceryl phosphate synthase n=1 Tax=Alteribacillus bidgolensis TaxID=930129 RepID=A0A1G8KCF9_9BACI|nr:heptaprenylglyceryl phosphate synthase [Alteribacillus bidgolensis]SDI41107.1 putative glycerol-1-phosphate prenyltransferase [Alteribacillus bidgolensis]
MLSYTEWKHVFKLDPAKELSDEDLEAICESGTDAIIIGGSDNVTLDNTISLLARVRRYSVACALEVSTLDSITPGFDYFFIPTVLNAGDPRWITGMHRQALKEYGTMMNWEEIVTEGYCILNSDAKVSSLTEADTALNQEDVEAAAMLADRLFHLPVFYLEYSGVYGDPAIVKACADTLKDARLFYGGGIKTTEQAAEMAAFADTVVVGNIVYEDVKAALKTVKAVKNNGSDDGKNV